MPAPRENLLKIGEFARLAKTNLRTIRYYEEFGLLRPSARSRGGFRYYEPADLAKFEAVQRLQVLGLPLAKIREIFSLPRDGVKDRPEMLARSIEALEEERRLVRAGMRRLETHLREVESALRRVKECCGCPMQPPLGEPYCDPCELDGKPLPGPFRALL